jgi:dihydrofolate reductase
MRKIIAGLFISLDGVVESPEKWHFPYFNDEMGAAVQAQIDESDTMLLGRNMYQQFAAFWPHQGDDVELASHMNGVRKLVASTTLTGPLEWENASLIEGNVIETLRELQQQPGKNMNVVGSIGLVRSLLAAGVLDELHLLVHPIVVGAGTKLFDGVDQTGLTLLSSQTFSTGVLNLVYAPADR